MKSVAKQDWNQPGAGAGLISHLLCLGSLGESQGVVEIQGTGSGIFPNSNQVR